jgi:murein DD-endopeptidase MepM/ murein hydrolase activator NlpD
MDRAIPTPRSSASSSDFFDTFFLGGRVVYIDHGGGLTTDYLHLSKVLVAPGDAVARADDRPRRRD